MKKIMITACATGLLACLAVSAQAQTVAQPSGPIGDISGFAGRPQTLPRVIDRVAQMTGGKVIAARYSRQEGRGGFDVVATKGGQLQFLRVAREGDGLQILQTNSRPMGALDGNKRHEVRLARDARIPLDEAVLTAERAAGAPAVAAGIARGGAGLSAIHVYNVVVDYPDGHTHRVAVDDHSGMVISDPSVLNSM